MRIGEWVFLCISIPVEIVDFWPARFRPVIYRTIEFKGYIDADALNPNKTVLLWTAVRSILRARDGFTIQFREQTRGVNQKSGFVHCIQIKILSAVEADRVLADEPACRRIVVSGAVVIQASFGVRFAGRVLEWIR